MFQDDEYGKNVLDGFTQQLAAMKIKSGTETSYKRGVSDFSAQVARMKADGCDLVVLGTVIRETIGAMTEARKIGWTVDFLGAGPTNVIEVPVLGKEAVEGLYARHHPNPCNNPVAVPPDPHDRSGSQAHQQKPQTAIQCPLLLGDPSQPPLLKSESLIISNVYRSPFDPFFLIQFFLIQ